MKNKVKEIFFCPKCQSEELVHNYSVELSYNTTMDNVKQDLKDVTPKSGRTRSWEETGGYKHAVDGVRCKDCGWHGTDEDCDIL